MADESAALLKAEGVYKYFGAITALRDVNFHVNGGEVLGVVGDNGAGKSTLMKILSGLYAPSEGTLIFDGKPVHFGSPRDARNMVSKWSTRTSRSPATCQSSRTSIWDASQGEKSAA